MPKRIYLDYAASTPVDRRVERAMAPYFGAVYGNPSALHRFGQEASAAVFAARRAVAAALGADYREIIFTGSATEANNLAIRGAVKAYNNAGGMPRIITTAIEHESVLETCRDLEREGLAEVVYVPVGEEGIVDPQKVASALNEWTILVSVMHANNEIGTIQPVQEIARLLASRRAPGSPYPLFHSDAVQSFQYLECVPKHLGVDLLTISAHKIYGPKGVGALYVRKGVGLSPIITGSGQEAGRRSGTENVPYLAGFARAVEIAAAQRASEGMRVAAIRNYFWDALHDAVPSLKLNGSWENRLPNNLNIYFPGQTAHDLQIKLDLAGIAASPGAACSTRVSKTSYVLEALGFSKSRAGGSLRFSVGRGIRKTDINYVVKIIRNVLK